MFGDFATRVAAEKKTIDDLLGALPAAGSCALDLGCGSGFQSLALAQSGYRVTALDSSKFLLDELKHRVGSLPIQVRLGELQEIRAFPAAQYDLITCMGDTLAHLSGREEIDAVLQDAVRLLKKGGRLLLGFRDQSRTLAGADRVILVRSDATRIMTCILEYEGNERMIVTDIFHELIDSEWKLLVGSYPKVRLRSDKILRSLETMGVQASATNGAGGMTFICAVKPVS